MIDSKYLWGGAIGLLIVVVIALIFYGNAREREGRDGENSRWLLEIANRPIERETTFVTKTVQLPPEHLEAPAITNDADSVLDILNRALSDTVDVLRSRLINAQASVTLHDSLGGNHAITYFYGTNRFSEDYTPGPIIKSLMTVHERQELPYEMKRIWVAGISAEYMKGPGFGAHIGLKPLRLGVSYFPTKEQQFWSFRITTEWEF